MEYRHKSCQPDCCAKAQCIWQEKERERECEKPDKQINKENRMFELCKCVE